jgi:hypothetical protein
LAGRNVSARVSTGHVGGAARGDIDPEGGAAETGDLTSALEKRPLVGACGRADEVAALRGRGGRKGECRNRSDGQKK